MSKAWRGANNRQWSVVRKRVMDENARVNGGRCTLQIRGVCTGQAEQAHHVLGRATTGDDTRYLTAVCAACNVHVGDPSAVSPRHRSVSQW